MLAGFYYNDAALEEIIIAFFFFALENRRDRICYLSYRNGFYADSCRY